MAEAEILLHICCGPCAAGAITQLLAAHKNIRLYFSNSNLASAEEYARRLEAAEIVATHFQLPLHVDAYDHAGWLAGGTAALSAEPEGGRRCVNCFKFNLNRTALMARQLHLNEFTTSLSISPYKDGAAIVAAAAHLNNFVFYDFRPAYRRSIEISKELGIYRQKFCGCEFSLRRDWPAAKFQRPQEKSPL